MHQCAPSSRPDLSGRPGFSLIELVMVVAIMAVVAAIAVPRMSSAVENGKVSSFVRTAQIFSKSIDLYYAEKRTYPPSTNVGDTIPDSNKYIDPRAWTAPTPVGGNWAFRKNETEYRAGILAKWADGDDPPDESLMTRIDHSMDDGNLSTGMFRKISPRAYVIIIEGANATVDADADLDAKDAKAPDLDAG